MKLNLRPAWVFLSPFVLILVLAFQNCSDPSQMNSQNNAAATQKFGPTTQAGNGEGYGGKLNGIYATVDNLNQCGQATTTQVAVKEQIEIQNGLAQKTVENCQRLVRPKTIALSNVQATSQAGNLFVLQGQIFERAKWVPTGYAPKDQYIDVFCMGEDSTVQSPVQRNLELFIYNPKESSNAMLPGMETLPFNPFAIRRAELIMLDQNIQTSEIIKTQNFAYELKESMTVDSATGSMFHSFEIADSFQAPHNMGFELSYSTFSSSSSSTASSSSSGSSYSSSSAGSSFSSTGSSSSSTSSSSSFGSIVPTEMSYGPGQTLRSVSESICWSHK